MVSKTNKKVIFESKFVFGRFWRDQIIGIKENKKENEEEAIHSWVAAFIIWYR